MPQKTYADTQIEIDTPLFDLLAKESLSIALSSFQSSAIYFISVSKQTNRLSSLVRSLERPMGMFYNGKHLIIAEQDNVTLYSQEYELTKTTPTLNKYDTLFFPRLNYITPQTDIHDIHMHEDTIYALNTTFSCISKLNTQNSISPFWTPDFIKEATPGDLCHLNGMLFEDNTLKYVTALSKSTTQEGWKQNLANGILIDAQTNKIIANNLAIPHSPILYKNKLYLVLSAIGQLIEINPKTGKQTTLCEFPGFLRGISQYKDYLFISYSKVRTEYFESTPIAQKAKHAGFMAYHIPSKKIIGALRVLTVVDEIYDIQTLPNMTRPNLFTLRGDQYRQLLTMSDGRCFRMAPPTV